MRLRLAQTFSHVPPKRLTEAGEQTLTTFLGGVLAKKYTNPSSDIIAVLAGLDEVDHVIAELLSAIDGTIRHGVSCMTSLMTLVAFESDLF
jgi:hypothetical protein